MKTLFSGLQQKQNKTKTPEENGLPIFPWRVQSLPPIYPSQSLFCGQLTSHPHIVFHPGLFPVAVTNIAKVSKAHIPPAVAIRGHTTLIGKREKSTNKGTDMQYAAEFSIHSATCHIGCLYQISKF